MKIEYELEELELLKLLKELDNIHMPVFKEESIEEEKETETENENEKEDNTRIYTSKLFKDFNELYEYILDISSDIKKNIPKYNANLFKISNLSELEKLNSSYRKHYEDMYRRLDKIEAFLHLRKSLNVSDNNIVKNNSVVSKDVMKIKRVLFSFSVKLVLKKEMFLKEKNNKNDIANNNDRSYKSKEKLRQKEERKRKEEDKKLKYIKEQQDTILRKKHEFNKNILYLKRYGIEGNEKVLDNNLELFLEIYNAYSNIYTKEELFEKFVCKSKVIRSDWFYENAKSALSEENILKYLFLKKKIIEKKLLLKKYIERLSKEVERERENKKEKENNYNIITVEKANEIILNVLEVLGEEYTNTLERVFGNNQIDYFKRKNKQRVNTTMAIYDGYILLQNDRKKDINIYTYIHELGHLIRYMKGTYTDVNAIEEMFAIFNEKLLFDYLKEYTKEYEEEKKNDDSNDNKNNYNYNYNEYNEIVIKKYMILVCDGLLNFLDMTFNTLAAYIFQEELISRIYEGDNDNIEELKEFALNKRKDILETMKKLTGDEKEDKKELYDFLLTNVYLKPYYPITYYLAVVLTFNILKEIKQREENSNNNSNELYNLICNDNLNIDNILETYNICDEDIFNIFELLEYYKNASKKI